MMKIVIHARQTRGLFAVHLGIALFASGCRTSTPAGIDHAMATCIPANASVLAGLNLTELRASTSYPKLPAGMRALIEPFRRADYALFASDGVSLAAISRGPFREAMAGGTLLAPGLAMSGSPQLVRAGAAQYSAGTVAARDLLAHAEPLAATVPVWIALRGRATLARTGNAANVHRLLRATDYATLALDIRGPMVLEITGICRTPAAGLDFEQSLRAMLSLAAAANARQPELTTLLRAIQIRREGGTVRVTLSTNPEALDQLLRAF